MKQPISITSQPESENKCPDCLYIELKGIPIQSNKRRIFSLSFNRKSTRTAQINLELTINFNEQWEPLFGGRIKFGLKGGELRLKVTNGKIPYGSRELAGSLNLELPKERQQHEGKENQSGIEASLTESKPGVKANFSTKKTLTRTDKFQFTVCQVTTKGSESNPAWVFEVETGEPVLKGLLKKVKLGTLDVATNPCLIEATFEVSLSDVQLTGAEGLWSKDIIPEKRAVLDRKLALLLLQKKLTPYLSRVQLSYV